MVKSVLVALAALIITTPLFAQGAKKPAERHEISTSYGALPVTDWVANFGKIIIGAFVGMSAESTDWGAVTVGYLYRVNSRISVGAQVAYATGEDTFTIQKQSSTVKNTYVSIMPSFKINWLNASIVTLYSRASAGITLHTATFDSESSSVTGFAYQISPVGVEVGRRLAGYAEVGIGVSGSAIVGIRYRF